MSPPRRPLEKTTIGSESQPRRDCDVERATNANRELIRDTSRLYRQAYIHILGYDSPRIDDGGWPTSEIDAGNIGGLFRLEYLGVRGINDRFVDWLQRFANQSHLRGRPLSMPSDNHLGTYR